VARLTVTPSSGAAPLGVTANASASSDADGSIASYRFDFGDGTVVGPQSGSTATHTFAAGTWTVRVTVTDNQGATGSAAATVTATAQSANQAPVAVLTVAPNTGIAPLPVVASGVLSSDPDGKVVSYQFDFGDGTVAGPLLLATATHIYRAGNWTARLTVTDDRGATNTASVGVSVLPGLPLVVSGPLPQGPTPGSPDAFADASAPLSAGALRMSPDPVRGPGMIEFALPTPGVVSLRVFDVSGRLVRTVVEHTWSAAGHVVLPLDGRDEQGATLHRGIYFLALETPDGRRTARFVVSPTGP
jgi:hypothetical protein